MRARCLVFLGLTGCSLGSSTTYTGDDASRAETGGDASPESDGPSSLDSGVGDAYRGPGDGSYGSAFGKPCDPSFGLSACPSPMTCLTGPLPGHGWDENLGNPMGDPAPGMAGAFCAVLCIYIDCDGNKITDASNAVPNGQLCGSLGGTCWNYWEDGGPYVTDVGQTCISSWCLINGQQP